MVFLKEEVEIYVCKICDYVYDSYLGDPEGGINPCTIFDKLPDHWRCPICGAAKGEFEKENC